MFECDLRALAVWVADAYALTTCVIGVQAAELGTIAFLLSDIKQALSISLLVIILPDRLITQRSFNQRRRVSGLFCLSRLLIKVKTTFECRHRVGLLCFQELQELLAIEL
jgi:hypothetical protein